MCRFKRCAVECEDPDERLLPVPCPAHIVSADLQRALHPGSTVMITFSLHLHLQVLVYASLQPWFKILHCWNLADIASACVCMRAGRVVVMATHLGLCLTVKLTYMCALFIWRILLDFFQEEQLIPPVQKLHALQLACYAQACQLMVCCKHQLASVHVLQAATIGLPG